MRRPRLLTLTLAFAMALGASLRGQIDPPDELPEVAVLVVPIEGPIGTVTVALVNRAVRRANSIGAAWVVLEIDTPGGDLLATQEVESILTALRGSGVKTVSFVRNNAYSAGAYIALACAQTFMAPNSSIGAVTPVMVGPGGVQDIPSDSRRKSISVVRSEMRQLAQNREASPDVVKLAEAMVDPDMALFRVTYRDAGGVEVTRLLDAEELRALEGTGAEIIDQQGFGTRPLTLTNREAAEWGLSTGTVSSISDLVRSEFNLPPESAERLERTWSETTAEWLEGIKPFLFLIGFILLLIEAKTPGFAVPGALGVLLLGLGLFSSYLVGLAEWTEIILFFLGLAAIAVEIFVMPGSIVFGLTGFVLVVSALILSQQTFIIPGNETQVAILQQNLIDLLLLIAGVVAGAVMVWRFLPNVPVFNRVMLQPPDAASLTGTSDRFAGDEGAREKLVGRIGNAVTDLRPTGILEMDGERYDVVTTGGFVVRGQPVQIVEIRGNVIVVESTGDQSGEVNLGLLIMLLLIGLGCVVAEIFFVSFGVLSIAAAISLVTSVFLAFTHHGQATGFTFLVACAIGVPVTMYLTFKALPNTRLGRKLLLAGPAQELVTKAAQEPGLEQLTGKRGVTLSDLRPTGYAQIDGRRTDVVTRGEFLERGQAVKVVEIEGNRVVVAPDHDAK